MRRKSRCKAIMFARVITETLEKRKKPFNSSNLAPIVVATKKALHRTSIPLYWIARGVKVDV